MRNNLTIKVNATREVLGVFAGIFIVWGLYRLLFRLPVFYEEVILKAVVFGGPVGWLAKTKLKWQWHDLGISAKRLFPSVYMGLFLGILMGLLGQVGNLVRYGKLNFFSGGLGADEVGQFVILSLVTAFWEQLLFSGYILRRWYQSFHNEWLALWWTAVLFVILHLPALVIVQLMAGGQLVLALFLLLTMQLGCGILRLRFGNLAAPMLVQALWGITIYLFR